MGKSFLQWQRDNGKKKFRDHCEVRFFWHKAVRRWLLNCSLFVTFPRLLFTSCWNILRSGKNKNHRLEICWKLEMRKIKKSIEEREINVIKNISFLLLCYSSFSLSRFFLLNSFADTTVKINKYKEKLWQNKTKQHKEKSSKIMRNPNRNGFEQWFMCLMSNVNIFHYIFVYRR